MPDPVAHPSTTEVTHEYGRSFAADIEHRAKGEPIEAVVIGREDDWDYHDDTWFRNGKPPEGILTWEEARPFLDYAYDDGYGGADCAPVWAWTATRVIFIGTYDGSTWVQDIPRSPTEGNPSHIGGG